MEGQKWAKNQRTCFNMISKTALQIAAASAGVVFVGYCIYFDRKRRSDPQFKQKLRESE